jgi:AraC-like DNA-binding protein
MNVQEKFDGIMNFIEDLVENEDFLESSEMVDKVLSKLCMNSREANTIFSFLVGTTLIEYIRKRRLMASFKLLLNQEKLEIDPAIALSGLQNQSSFDKRFKQMFNMSPKEAHKIKDNSLYTSPIAWDDLSSDDVEIDESDRVSKTEYMFGVSKEQYNNIVEYQENQALYDFDEVQCKVVYEFIEKTSLPIKVAFEITNKISEQYYTYGLEDMEMSAEELKEYIPSADAVVYLYQNVTQNMSQILELIEETFGEIKDIEPFYIKEYLETYNELYPLDEYIDLIKKFVKLGGEDIEEYFEFIELGYDPEGAVELSNNFMDEEYDKKLDRLECVRDWIENTKDNALDRWVAEETDYSKK